MKLAKRPSEKVADAPGLGLQAALSAKSVGSCYQNLLDRSRSKAHNPRQITIGKKSYFTAQPVVLLRKIPPGQSASLGQTWFELEGDTMLSIARSLWREEQGQDIAEYAVMLAVILVIVVGTIRLVGSNANNVFSSVGSSIQ
jgi:Flp pilus assembly pilin Flp